MSNSNQNTNLRIEECRARVLKKYELTIKEELGRGVSGIAFLVMSPDGDLYVVKEIYSRDMKDMDKVINEVEILKKLKHGYIVTYEDSFEDEKAGLFYVMMEYCAGGDLYKKMEAQTEKGIFEEEQIIDWLVQICLALQYIHGNNVLHGDLKPQNVFLTEDDYINLGDFGCSKDLEKADAYSKSVVGAELYISPDVFQNKYNSKSDIWSLGWLLHDLCMLEVWSNPIQRRFLHVSSMTGITPKIAETYSEDLQKIICQMLSCNPEDRPSANKILATPFLRDAVERNKRIPDQLEEKFMKSTENFDEAYKNSEAFLNEMEKTTDCLEEMHRKCTIGSLSGAVIGAAGGITALVGAILAPFTLGASLIVTGVGIGVSVAGGVTGAASNITDTVKQKSLLNSLEIMEQKYKMEGALIFSSPKTLKYLRKIAKFSDFVSYSTFSNVQMTWRVGRSTAMFAAELACLLLNVGRISAQAVKLGRAAVAASGVLSGLLVFVDGAFIFKDSQEIHEIRQQGKIDDPEKVKSSMLKSIAKLRKTHKELCALLNGIKETRESILKKRRENRPGVKTIRYMYNTSQTNA